MSPKVPRYHKIHLYQPLPVCCLFNSVTERVVPTPDPHNSVCPRFCPELVRVGLSGVVRVGLPVAQKVGLADL